MPMLRNPRHEAFAVFLAKGYSQIKAYCAAGYKRDPAHASTLAGKANVKARVAELREEVARNVIKSGSYDAVTLFDRVRKVAEAALKAGDHKTALAGEIFIAECFGYRDSPTLTHEHVAGKKLVATDAAAVQKEAGEPNAMRFANALAELRKARVLPRN